MNKLPFFIFSFFLAYSSSARISFHSFCKVEGHNACTQKYTSSMFRLDPDGLPTCVDKGSEQLANQYCEQINEKLPPSIVQSIAKIEDQSSMKERRSYVTKKWECIGPAPFNPLIRLQSRITNSPLNNEGTETKEEIGSLATFMFNCGGKDTEFEHLNLQPSQNSLTDKEFESRFCSYPDGERLALSIHIPFKGNQPQTPILISNTEDAKNGKMKIDMKVTDCRLLSSEVYYNNISPEEANHPTLQRANPSNSTGW